MIQLMTKVFVEQPLASPTPSKNLRTMTTNPLTPPPLLFDRGQRFNGFFKAFSKDNGMCFDNPTENKFCPISRFVLKHPLEVK